MGAVFDHFPRLPLSLLLFVAGQPCTTRRAPAFYRTVFIYLLIHLFYSFIHSFTYLFIYLFIYKVRKHRVSGISTYAYYHIASPTPRVLPRIAVQQHFIHIFEFATRGQPSIEHISAFREKYRRSFSYRLVARLFESRNNNRCSIPIDRSSGGEGGLNNETGLGTDALSRSPTSLSLSVT